MTRRYPPYELFDLQQEAKERMQLASDAYPVWVDDEGYNLTVPGQLMPEFLGRTPSEAMRRIRHLFPHPQLPPGLRAKREEHERLHGSGR